jgi:hypothetical protein
MDFGNKDENNKKISKNELLEAIRHAINVYIYIKRC